ncbi:MAG TPA: hypothetical protein VJM08_11865 [Anaerolineales bacterium]|nr:hypothetical protein [Anaerolineales bacterium]
MALKSSMTRVVLAGGLLLIVFTFLLLNTFSGTALGKENLPLPDFKDFIDLVENGNVNVLSGVYVPNLLALPIVQQPAGDAGYVSGRDDEATQFAMASEYGNIGLLAHNYLSGRFFSQLTAGQEVRLVYGDGKVEYFIITEVLRYRALDPYSEWSSFRHLDNQDVLSAEQMFTRAYTGDRHITFQTCIEANGNSSWGRLFVIAIPKSISFESLIQQILQ